MHTGLPPAPPLTAKEIEAREFDARWNESRRRGLSKPLTAEESADVDKFWRARTARPRKREGDK